MTTAPALIAFGSFVLDRAKRTLSCRGRPVPLGGRTYDLLGMLVERPGEVLTHAELIAGAWPRSFVEETSLRVQMSMLRRALSEADGQARHIANVPGRGYSFVGTLQEPPGASEASDTRAAIARPSHNLPCVLTAPIGRECVIDELRASLGQRRLVSIVGAGGMGKTTVAVAAAEAALGLFPDGVRFVDLAPVADPHRVLPTVAAACGLMPSPAGRHQRLAEHLRDRRVLIVLDNCEQVIDAAAELVHAIMTGTSAVCILATSRESLNVEGEWVHRLPPLGLPVDDGAAGMLAPSVQLFVQRAVAQDDGFALTPANAPLVNQLCRDLDGMPLAIELAAARVTTFGIPGLVNGLSDMFRMLTRGRRTAPPRHQTLQGLLDWSYALLTDTDRTVLRRLAVFRSVFSVETAVPVLTCGAVDINAAMDSLLGLVSKSLVAVDKSQRPPRYRLLVTTRAYAMAKLMASGEWNDVSRRHAEQVRFRLEAANAEIEDLDVEALNQRLPDHGVLIDDLRGALAWADTATGEARLGATLMNLAAKLVWHLGLVDEFRPWMETALRQAQSLVPLDRTLEFRAMTALCLALGVSRDHVDRHPGVFDRLISLVDQVSDMEDRLSALNSLLIVFMGRGEYASVADLARRVIQIAAPRTLAATFLGERFLAQGLHGLGRHGEALELIDQILAYPTRKSHVRYVGNVPVAVSLRVLKARISWMCGGVDDALDILDECVGLARGTNPWVLAHVLALGAVPIAMWRGDDEAAARWTAELRELAGQNSLDYWASWSTMCELALLSRSGAGGAGVPVMLQLTARESEMASTWEAELVTPLAIQRAHASPASWAAAETLRATTEQQLREGQIDPEAADLVLQRAIVLAHEQNAPSWLLRAATSRARLWSRQGRRGEAFDLVERTLARFTQGQGTRDHQQARRLLDSLLASPAPA